MHDTDCVDFLQWALPQLHMRWPGFRKVRARVCKRITQRLRELDLQSIDDYRARLEREPQEWAELDLLCRLTITRFYRDRRVFETLTRDILPPLATAIRNAGGAALRCWSIGCASGEEPYTLAILWRERLAGRFAQLRFEVLATDADPELIERAHRACYPPSALKNLPAELCVKAFAPRGGEFCLKAEYQGAVRFRVGDIRYTLPEGPFHLILCRNLVFTYFDEALQQAILPRLYERLHPGGWLILGVHELLPPQHRGFTAVSQRLGLYRRV